MLMMRITPKTRESPSAIRARTEAWTLPSRKARRSLGPISITYNILMLRSFAARAKPRSIGRRSGVHSRPGGHLRVSKVRGKKPSQRLGRVIGGNIIHAVLDSRCVNDG